MLSWNLEWGSQLETLTEIQETTGITPAALARRPKLEVESLPYWDAFWVLSDARSYGYSGPLAVAVGEVAAYLSLIEERDVAERTKFLRLIQAMDKQYLKRSYSKTEITKP